MTKDIDIYRTAKDLMRDHGDKAVSIAGKLADECLDQGDVMGSGVWLSVVEAIDDLNGDRRSA